MDMVSERLRAEASRHTSQTSGTTGAKMEIPMDLASLFDLQQGSFEMVAQAIPGLAEKAQPYETSVALVSNKYWREYTSVLLLTLRASLLRYLVMHRSAAQDLDLLQALRGFSVPLLYGKPTYLLELMELDRSMEPGGAHIAPFAILVSGESLFEDDRAKLEDWYRSPVFNAYVSTEGGLMAIECPCHNGLHVNESRVRLEVLLESGEIRPEGSGELLVTNLWNWGMPFIRFRSGDYGSLREPICPCGRPGPVLVDFTAREAREFACSTGSFDPRFLDALFQGLPVRQFQVTQLSATTFAVKWMPTEAMSPENLHRSERRIVARLRGRLGDARVEITAVDRITPCGGKAQRYRSELLAESRHPSVDVLS